MDFNELITANEATDDKKKNRVEREANRLRCKVIDLFKKLDVGMLKAISKYGNRKYINYTSDIFSSFAYNGYEIIVDEKWRDDNHKDIIILKDGYGFKKDCWGPDPILIEFDLKNSIKFHAKRIDYKEWVVAGHLDSVKYPCDSDMLRRANHRMCGDDRDTYEQIADALPEFEKAFSEYLIERSKSVK